MRLKEEHMAKSAYDFKNTRNKKTPQSRPIAGRESEMVENVAGGYAFKASDWQALRRWLLTGSMQGAFYQGKEEMTDANIKTLMGLVSTDPVKVAEEIVDASKKGVSVHTPIFALTLLSTGNKQAKDAFKDIFPRVIRTGSQLYEFMNYTKGHRGFGSVIHKAVGGWLDHKDAKELEYQFLKYQSRYDWSARDVLRVIKPKTRDEIKRAVYNWSVGGTTKNPLMDIFPEELERINVYEKLKKGASESDVVDAIRNYRMTWEMIPGNIQKTKKIWAALFENMPVGATIRNLGNLTEKGVFGDTKYLDMLEQRFAPDNLKRAFIHPVNFAEALMIYQDGGKTGRGKLEWTPVGRVVDAMEDGIDASFEAIEPTGLNFFHALDVSGSMHGFGFGIGSGSHSWLKPFQIEGIMSLATIRSEKNYFIGGFDTNFTPMTKFNRKTSYGQVVDFRSGLWPGNFGGTDASVAYRYAIDKNIKADVFVFWTDAESWAGGGIWSRRNTGHTSELFKEYRNRINKDAKAVYVTLVPYSDQITLADPKCSQSYDIAGFTSQTPKLINMIARGEV